MGYLDFSPAISESPGRVTAEVSLRLMIMNYAEGHILLVTSHLHDLPLDCLGLFNFFFLLLGNNSLNRCWKLNLLTFYFSSIMPSLQNNGGKKTPTLSEIIAVTVLLYFCLLVCQDASHFKGLTVLIFLFLCVSPVYLQLNWKGGIKMCAGGKREKQSMLNPHI